MKQFNRISAIARWGVAISFTMFLGLLLTGWIQHVNESPIWAAGIFVMVPIIQFFSTPLFTLLGIYTYYSPMVVSLGSNDRVINLHNGTSFDYLLEMRRVKPGLPWKKLVSPLNRWVVTLCSHFRSLATQSTKVIHILQRNSHLCAICKVSSIHIYSTD